MNHGAQRSRQQTPACTSNLKYRRCGDLVVGRARSPELGYLEKTIPNWGPFRARAISNIVIQIGKILPMYMRHRERKGTPLLRQKWDTYLLEY